MGEYLLVVGAAFASLLLRSLSIKYYRRATLSFHAIIIWNSVMNLAYNLMNGDREGVHLRVPDLSFYLTLGGSTAVLMLVVYLDWYNQASGISFGVKNSLSILNASIITILHDII